MVVLRPPSPAAMRWLVLALTLGTARAFTLRAGLGFTRATTTPLGARRPACSEHNVPGFFSSILAPLVTGTPASGRTVAEEFSHGLNESSRTFAEVFSHGLSQGLNPLVDRKNSPNNEGAVCPAGMVNALTSATAATRRRRQRGDAEGRRGTRRRRRPRPDADAQTKIIGGGDIAAKMR